MITIPPLVQSSPVTLTFALQVLSLLSIGSVLGGDAVLQE